MQMNVPSSQGCTSSEPQQGHWPFSSFSIVISFFVILRCKGNEKFRERSEVGLFLGYPPEDVAGFIEHRGQSFSYSGYWKVYTNEEATRKLFDRYTRCTREFCNKLELGMNFSELLTTG